MFAVIKTGGKQYKVSPGDTITIEKLSPIQDEVTFDDVLLLGGENVEVGRPTLTNTKVTASLVKNFRGEKIRVFKFKAKSHWQKTIGHRQSLTQVLIKDIVTGSKTKKETKED